MSDGNGKPEKAKKRVNRSPKHPAFDLGTAIERTRELYKAAWDHSVGVDSACEVWGLSYSSSTGRRAISALLQFGLLESEGSRAARSVQLTERAKDIVTDEDGVTPERKEAIRACALAPASYKEMWDRWGPKLPADDRSIVPWLIKEQGFNPSSTADFLRDFRATVRYAGLDKQATDGHIGGEGEPGNGTDVDSDKPPGREHHEPPKRSGKVPMQASNAKVQELTIPLRGGGMAILSVPVPMTRQNYEKLTGWLAWAEDTLVMEDEPAGAGVGGDGEGEAAG